MLLREGWFSSIPRLLAEAAKRCCKYVVYMRRGCHCGAAVEPRLVDVRNRRPVKTGGREEGMRDCSAMGSVKIHRLTLHACYSVGLSVNRNYTARFSVDTHKHMKNGTIMTFICQN